MNYKYAKIIRKVRKGISYGILVILSFSFLLPFFWMVSTAFKLPNQVYQIPPVWIPIPGTIKNFFEGWKYVNFTRYTINTLFITSTATTGTILTSSLVAYGFARFKSKWNDRLFIIVIATLMIPAQVTLIPSYVMFSSIGWVDTYLPLIIPSWLGGGAFNIFLLRQFIRGIPKDLDDAAKLDGCNSFQIFSKIMLPVIKPALTTVGMMAIIANWNDFMGPLIYLSSESKYTISIGLQFFNSTYGVKSINLLMAVSVLTVLPIILLFFLAQKYFVQGIAVSGIKG